MNATSRDAQVIARGSPHDRRDIAGWPRFGTTAARGRAHMTMRAP